VSQNLKKKRGTPTQPGGGGGGRIREFALSLKIEKAEGVTG